MVLTLKVHFLKKNSTSNQNEPKHCVYLTKIRSIVIYSYHTGMLPQSENLVWLLLRNL